MSIRCAVRVLVAGTVVLLQSALYAGQAGAPTYLERLRERAIEWQKALPDLRASATGAAVKVIAGGNLYVAGPQVTFSAEANGRAGGLMLARCYSETPPLTNTDVVLAATTTTNQSADLQRLFANADRAGATVILFGNGYLPPVLTNANFHLLPAKSFAADGAQAGPSIESLSNLIGLWAWTGEFIAACVARGKMPCIYESYGMPDGKERADALKGLKFHETTTVMPVDAKDLGARFLKKVALSLKQSDAVNRDEFAKASAMIRDCYSTSNAINVDGIGHIFPAEFQQGQTLSWFHIGNSAVPRKPGDLTIFLGYQSFPWTLAKSAAADGSRCVVACSHLALPEFTSGHGNVYLNPCWDVQDGCLELNGYDVRLLPLSGIMDGAIFWQLVDLAISRPSSAR